MPPLTDFDRRYIQLALEIEKHIPGYVDAYIGPPELRQEVEASPPRSPQELLDEAQRLRGDVPDTSADRAAYLQGALRAIEGTLRILNGDQLDYLDEVALLYDIEPQQVDETTFENAHRELEALLPGTGSLSSRLTAWREKYEMSLDQLLPLIELTREETRRRTAQLVDLIPGESLEIQVVENQPWSAYNWFLGDAHSRIEFNSDLPVSVLSLLDLFAHEGYPGHHTEHQLKEQKLYKEKGYGEQAIFLLHSPSAVIAEGIATTALEIIFPAADPTQDYHAWNEQFLLPQTEIAGDPAAQIRGIAEARKKLRYVSGNAAILFHTNQLTREQTIDYIQTYTLSPAKRAEKSFEFISSPLYRSYVFTYSWGYDLLERAARATTGGKQALFKRLLSEQVLPSHLAAMASAQTSNTS
jgi:hypothetical protein